MLTGLVGVFPVSAQRPDGQQEEARERGLTRRPCSLGGRILYAENFKPAEGIQVQLWTAAGTLVDRTFAFTNGRFQFLNLQQGGYILEVSEEDYQPMRVLVDLSFVCQHDTTVLLLERKIVTEHRTPAAGGPVALRELQIPGKARKAFQKGLTELYQRKKPDNSLAHFRRALELFADYIEAYLHLGVAHLQRAAYGEAARVLEQATALDARNASAYTLLGIAHGKQGQSQQAVSAFERAVELDPNAWVAYLELGKAALAAGRTDDAWRYGQQAHELNPQAASAHLFLYNVLIEQKDYAAALEEIDEFLALDSESALAATVRQRREALRRFLAEEQAASAAAAASASPPAVLTARETQPAPALPALLESRTPLDVERTRAPLAPGVACSLEEVVGPASRRVGELVRNLEQFTATEQIEHVELRANGTVRETAAQSARYLVFIREVRPGVLAVDEMRQGDSAAETSIQTNGLPALAFIFHPYYIEDYELRCAGLSQWNGQPAWLVFFRQRGDRPARIHTFKSRWGVFRAKLKGRAWIGANNHQILRLESDLAEPIVEIGLLREYFSVEYASVAFSGPGVELWLPARVEAYLEFGGRRFQRRHDYSEFRLFAVDVTEQVKAYR